MKSVKNIGIYIYSYDIDLEDFHSKVNIYFQQIFIVVNTSELLYKRNVKLNCPDKMYH